jgi:hypothetical protein
MAAPAGLLALTAGLLAIPQPAAAQAAAQPAARTQVRATPGAVNAPGGTDFVDTQVQLLKLLRLSPTLTEVVARDPSLLANQAYVNANNPELGQFLEAHPEVARNPGFYLFTNLPPGRGGEEQALEQKIWPEMGNQWRGHEQSPLDSFMNEVGPFVAFIGVTLSLLWLVRTLLENRRWNRIFKLQTEVHGKLIEKFGNNQDLLVYMGTDAGKKFLEAAPIPVNFEPQERMPGAVARVLMPLQIGIVASLLGLGLILLRHAIPDYADALLLFGTLALMPGLGFIISAGVTWVLAGRLGLMPDPARDAAAQAAIGRERL